jgi:FkbM family methyltransferase
MRTKISLTSKQIINSRKIRKRLLLAHKICYYLTTKLQFQDHNSLLLRNIEKLILVLVRYIARRFLPLLRNPIICPTVFGFDICLSKNGGAWVYYLGFYELGTLGIIRKCLQPGDIFIDVGSSIGLMTLTASFAVGKQGKVFSFEPDAKRYENLLNSIAINNIENVVAFNCGLGMEEKSTRLYKDRVSPSLIEVKRNAPYETVKIVSLDAILNKRKISTVKFIKIDVEGYEDEVLMGAEELLNKTNAPIICIEYAKNMARNSNSRDLLDIIQSDNDYKVFQLEKTKDAVSKLSPIRDRLELRNHDNLFCFLDSHIKYLPREMFS